MIFKEITAALCAAATALSLSLPVGSEEPAEPDVKTAKAAILTELSTGQPIFELNADLRLPIASVTKIMTLIIAAEEIEAGRLSFDDTAVCSDYAGSMDGSVIWLEAGEEMSVGDLIKSVVIASANDACVMLAEHIEGSEPAFVQRMNKTAARLGLDNTSFANCVGYDNENHYSTARDISVMAAELRQYSYFDDFLLTRLDSVRTGTSKESQLLNTNKLITSYNGITGLKTGTTDKAGCCLCATAERNGMELAAVVLGCSDDDDRFSAAKSLLDYGFNGYEKATPHPDVSELLEIPVENGVKSGADTRFSGVSPIILPKGGASRLKYHYSRTEKVSAPVSKGQTMGFVTVTLDDEVIGTIKIIAAEDVERLSFEKCAGYMFEALFTF